MSLWINQHHEQLFQRHPRNPILAASDWPYPIHTVFNAGATRLPDGTTLLLCRVEDRRGHSHFCAARSLDGVSGRQIEPQPTLLPDPVNHPEELWGIEDPRITFVPELNKYVVTYTSFWAGGTGVSLALSEDFRTFERYGVVMPPEDKDAALLPRRIGGHWALIHRPVTTWEPTGHMWISSWPDLRHWGEPQTDPARPPGRLVGCLQDRFMAAPIETPQGWLPIYHGVRHSASGCLYRLGLALFDLQTPECCAVILGFSALRNPMNGKATWPTWSFPAATRSGKTVTR